MWKRWLGEQQYRCLVPATAFSEYANADKKVTWFQRPSGTAFCFSGIWRPWTGDRGTKAKPPRLRFAS
jgi:putative SOS response-associated peptidase YedK